ncbi:MAG TPA: SHOCT domain-containing protein [Actinomycetota bacterium]
MGTFWIVVIVAAILLLRREVPQLRLPEHHSPALRVLEERYARGEISREEFLERREVLLRGASHPAPPPLAARPDQPSAPGDQAVGPSSGGGPASPPGAAPWSPEPPDPGSEPEPGEPTTPLS